MSKRSRSAPTYVTRQDGTVYSDQRVADPDRHTKTPDELARGQHAIDPRKLSTRASSVGARRRRGSLR